MIPVMPVNIRVLDLAHNRIVKIEGFGKNNKNMNNNGSNSDSKINGRSS